MTNASPAPITVRSFDHILFWPVQLKGKPFGECGGHGISKWTKWLVDKSDGEWREVGDLLNRDGETSGAQQLAEFVYFHPFVREILFAKEESRAVRLLKRDKINSVRVKLFGEPEEPPLTLSVPQVLLYLFDTGIAVLVVEITHSKELDLQRLENLLDSFRRTYRPYYLNPA